MDDKKDDTAKGSEEDVSATSTSNNMPQLQDISSNNISEKVTEISTSTAQPLMGEMVDGNVAEEGNSMVGDASVTDAANSEQEAAHFEYPSDVHDRKEIFMPLDVNRNDPRIYGKWLFFTNGDLRLQDCVWFQLQNVLKTGDIILLESSTAKRLHGRYQGVIKCYTADDNDAIKRAGVAIQKIVKDDTILNYKTNQASRDSLYRGYGDRFITKYMLTVNGKFYEKDELERWIQIKDSSAESDSGIRVPSTPLPPSKRNELGSKLLPSRETSKTRYIHPIYASLTNFSGLWFLFCNAVETDENGMTELDCIWNETRLLCDDGVFLSTTCETYAFTPRPAEISVRRSVSCELRNYLSIDMVLQSGDRLREKINYNMPMYFKVCCFATGKLSYILKYMYTEERELYEYIADKWKLLKRE